MMNQAIENMPCIETRFNLGDAYKYNCPQTYINLLSNLLILQQIIVISIKQFLLFALTAPALCAVQAIGLSQYFLHIFFFMFLHSRISIELALSKHPGSHHD